MKHIHASIKVTRKELDATNGYTVGECYTPFVGKLVEQVKEKTDGETYTWYLYDRYLEGPNGDVILILQNTLMEQKTRVQMMANMVAVFNGNFELINPSPINKKRVMIKPLSTL